MQKKQKRSTWVILLCAAALLALVILLENTMKPTHMLFTVLKKGAVYAVVASSMNLLNGFTGLFSLGQAGFMLLGAYTYAILTIPTAARESVYYIYQGSAVNFSLPELFGGGAAGLVLGVLAALVLAGFVAAVVAWLIGLPVLRLKSDYLAIATLGFGEIVRAILQWDKLGPVTNGANALKSFPTFSRFNIELPGFSLRLSTFVPFLLGAVCIGVILPVSYTHLSKRYMEDQITALLGGRVAEKLCLGDISTGASNDIQRASAIARKMVASYGMSERLGTVAFDSGHDEVFIGRTMTQGRSYSEAVAAQIDQEVQRLVADAYDRCERILNDNRDKLEAVASYLLEHETMEREAFLAVFGEQPLSLKKEEV